jgi:hypothetical protein
MASNESKTGADEKKYHDENLQALEDGQQGESHLLDGEKVIRGNVMTTDFKRERVYPLKSKFEIDLPVRPPAPVKGTSIPVIIEHHFPDPTKMTKSAKLALQLDVLANDLSLISFKREHLRSLASKICYCAIDLSTHCGLVNICPRCAAGAAKDNRRKIENILRVSVGSFFLLTFTMPNDDLEKTYPYFRRCLSKVLERLRRKNIVSGGFAGIEIVQPKQDGDPKYNLHCHMLVESPNGKLYKIYEKLKTVWSDLLGKEHHFGRVHIKKITKLSEKNRSRIALYVSKRKRSEILDYKDKEAQTDLVLFYVRKRLADFFGNWRKRKRLYYEGIAA